MKSGSSAPIATGGAVVGDAVHLLVQPDVAVGGPGHIAAGAAHDELADAAHALQRLVGIGLQRRAPAAARGLVGGDDELRARILDARAQRLGGEAGEDDRMHRADAGAGEHRVGGLGDHRQVDHHPVALLHAEGVQHVAELRDLLVQLAVGDVAGDVRVVALPDDRGLVAAGGEMAVDAVGRDVELAILEPFDRDVVVVERGVLDPGVGLRSSRAACPCSPQKASGSATEAAYILA